MASYSFPFYVQKPQLEKGIPHQITRKPALHVSLLSQSNIAPPPMDEPANLAPPEPKTSVSEDSYHCQPLEQPEDQQEAQAAERDRLSTKEAYQNIFSINLKAHGNQSSPQPSLAPQKLGIFVQNPKTVSSTMYEPIMEEPTLEVLETEEAANTSRPRVEINITQEGSLKLAPEKSKLQLVMSPSEISTTDCNYSKAAHENVRFKVDPNPPQKPVECHLHEAEAESNDVVQSIDNTPRRHQKLVLSQDGGSSEAYGSPHALGHNPEASGSIFTKIARIPRETVVHLTETTKEGKHVPMHVKAGNNFLRGSRSAHYPCASKQAQAVVVQEGPLTTETSLVEGGTHGNGNQDTHSFRGEVNTAASSLLKLDPLPGAVKLGSPPLPKASRQIESSWRKLSTPFSRTNTDHLSTSQSKVEVTRLRTSEGDRSKRKPALSISLGDKAPFKTTERKIESKSGSIPKPSQSTDKGAKLDISASSIQRLRKIIGSATVSTSTSQLRASSGMSERLKGLVQSSLIENPATNAPQPAPVSSVGTAVSTPHNPKTEPLFFKKKDPSSLQKPMHAQGSSRTKSPTKSRIKGATSGPAGESFSNSKPDDKLKSASNLSRPASSERSSRPLGLLAAALTKLQTKQSSGRKIETRGPKTGVTAAAPGAQKSSKRASHDAGSRGVLLLPSTPATEGIVSPQVELDMTKRRNTAESVGAKKSQKLNLQVHTPSLQNSRKTSIVELFSSGRMTPKRSVLTTCNILNMVPKDALRIPEQNKIVPFKEESEVLYGTKQSSGSKGSAEGGHLQNPSRDHKAGVSSPLKTKDHAEELGHSELVHEPSSYIIADNSCIDSGQSGSGGRAPQVKNHSVSVLQRHLTTVVMSNRNEPSGKEVASAATKPTNPGQGVNPRVLTSPKDTKSWGFSKNYHTKPTS